MLGYLGYVRVSDGQHSVELGNICEIYIKHKNGVKTRIQIGLKETKSNYYGKGKVGVILGHKITKGRGLVEELTYGKRYYSKNKFNIPYRKNTWTGIDGTIWRRSKIGNDKGICHTTFRGGKFKEQWFNYSNGVKAYHFRKDDNELKINYPNGNLRCEYIGTSAVYDKDLAKIGNPCLKNPEYVENCDYTEYARNGRIKHQICKRNNQIQGKHIKNGVEYFFVNGLAVPKELYEAKPEDLNPKAVLRINNAQVRGMMLKKVGLVRLIKECKGKLIDRDNITGNELYDFPCAYEKGEKVDLDNPRYERILKVVCPSTKTEYPLRIPYDEHFNTCEKARQGTFNGFDPEAKPIEFKHET